MNAGCVIDASVGFAWVHPNQATPQTDRLLQAVGAGEIIVVPSLWFLEIANGLLVLQRRKRLTEVARKAALELLGRLSISVDDAAGREVFQTTSELAEQHGLTVYDAAYLEVAIRRKLPLATRDASLQQAAKRNGLQSLFD